MFNAMQPWHLIILVLVVVLLFGAKRLPDAARSVGKSMKIFKAETKDMRKSDEAASSEPTAAAPVTEPDMRQLPQSTVSTVSTNPGSSTEDQVEQLQRQLDELKRQQANQQNQQPQQNAG